MRVFGDLIPENIAPVGARRIGIYNSRGNRLGYVPLGPLGREIPGRKLYSFGALSDIHMGESTAREDYSRALTWLSGNVDFICECGDLIHGDAGAAPAQIEQYKSCRAAASVPVYAIAGNHDGAYVSDIASAVAEYTGQPLYYSFTQGEDVFVFVGNASGTAGQLFTKAELQWLYETLEANRNRRCFLFQHVRPDDASGNALGIYTYDIWRGTEQTVFESLLRHYSNVVFFHGHSHLKFRMQEYAKGANYDRTFGCHSIHIPSVSVPREMSAAADSGLAAVYAASEGYVVEVYEGGIHLRGRDFVSGEYLPLASYWLDTPKRIISPETYTDSMGLIKT